MKKESGLLIVKTIDTNDNHYHLQIQIKTNLI